MSNPVQRGMENSKERVLDLEGKETKVLGWKDREAAYAVIRSSYERFIKQYVSR